MVSQNLYHCSLPDKRPQQGKHPDSQFYEINGECPLPDKRPGILSAVHNAKHQSHVAI